MGAQILGGEALHTRSGRHDHVSTEGVVARNEAHARRQGPHEPTEGGMRRYDVPEEREGERRRRTSPEQEWNEWGGQNTVRNVFQKTGNSWTGKEE